MSDITPLDWDKLYALQSENRIDRALDLIYRACCSFDERPNFAAIDAILAAVDLGKITTTTIAIGFLSASYPLSGHLPSYKPLLARVRVWLEAWDHHQIDDLLRGFDTTPDGRLVSVELGDDE